LDSDDEESNDLRFEFDEHIGEVAKHNVIRFEIQSDTNLRVAERNETDDDEIAILQGKKHWQHMRISLRKTLIPYGFN
jgi:hypothetical protein